MHIICPWAHGFYARLTVEHGHSFYILIYSDKLKFPLPKIKINTSKCHITLLQRTTPKQFFRLQKVNTMLLILLTSDLQTHRLFKLNITNSIC